MVGTLCIWSTTCGIIADMRRVLTGLAAWLAGTALAVGLAWSGANVVVRNAGVSPGVQVINADPAAPLTVPPVPPVPAAPPAPRASGTPGESDPARSAAVSSPSQSQSQSQSQSPSATPTATATAAGSVRSYTLAGGRVALLVTGDSAALMTAVPDSGFSVQTWSGTDWLRVDFSSGAQVSSLIASWYEHTPTVTVTS
jgi:hypothetical protein